MDYSEEIAVSNVRIYFEANILMFALLGFVRGVSSYQMAGPSRAGKAAKAAELSTLEEAVDAVDYATVLSRS